MKSQIISLFIILMMVIPASALFESTSLDQYIVRYNSGMDKAPSSQHLAFQQDQEFCQNSI